MIRQALLRPSLLVLLGVLSAGSAALAQGVTGSALTGSVTDPSGAPVPEANVQLRDTSTGAIFNATTDTSGRYVLDNVTPGGPFSLTVQGGIFEPVTREGIRLALGQKLTLDVKLTAVMGEAIEITVNNDALADNRRTGASTRVKATTIAKLPLQGRNFTDLVATDPRVTQNSVGGQNNRFNNIQIDGGANNDLFGLAPNGTPGGQSNAKPLSIEAVQEFVVQVAPFDVRYGNFAGGLVNAITKSGTNEFHGSLFTYYQGKALANPNSWQAQNGVFDNYPDPTFLDFNTLQFGASVGGPIIKDKLHFFIATDLQQKSQSFGSSNQIGGVDSASDIARAGFDNSVAQRFVTGLNKYGITGQGDALAPSLLNPDRNLFVKITSSQIPDSQLELSYNLVNANSDVLARNPVVSTLSPFSVPSGGYQLSNAGYGQGNTTNTGRVKLTTNFDGGRVSNEFLAGVSIIRDARNIATNEPLILVKVGKLGTSDSYLSAGGERFSQANVLDQNIYQLQDNLTLALGTHRLTVGTSNEFFGFRNVFFQAANGVWVFDSLDSFEAGNANFYQRRYAPSGQQDPGTARFNVTQLGAYVQDEWSPIANLTITPGVRFDVPLLPKANTNGPLAYNAAFPIDTGQVPSGNILWSPRIGFNWDVDGSSDTIIRGGVGVFSGRPPYVWISNAYGNNGLAQAQVTCFGATGVPKFTPVPGQQPFNCAGGTTPPGAPVNNGEIDYFDPNTKYPQNLRFSLGADRRLPFGIVGSVDFLYTKDLNGWFVTEENLTNVGTSGEGRALYGTFNPATGRGTPTRIDPVNLAQAVKVSNESAGYVTSLTFQLQRSFLQDYGISFGYTYARSMDPMSLTSSQAFSNFQFAPLDGTIASRNVRPSAFDRPHKLTVTATAQLPFGFGAALTYYGQSGLPYTWTVNGDVNGDGVNGNDLVYVPAKASDITLADPTQWDALNAFIESQDCLKNARGGFVQRGACRNPWQDFLDARFTWTSPYIKGEQRIEVQWDIFNVLNLLNPRWGHLNSVAGFENVSQQFLKATGYDVANNRPSYAFAQPSSLVNTAYSPTSSRWRMQFGARYLF